MIPTISALVEVWGLKSADVELCTIQYIKYRFN